MLTKILPDIVVNISACEREGIVRLKSDCSDKMVAAFTIKEKTIHW